jgi:uncharacterized protein YgiM (DUF1202 family)
MSEASQPPTADALSATAAKTANVRDYPSTKQGKVIDQLAAGTTITLLSKTSDGSWYEVMTPTGQQGYMSVTVLTVAPDMVANVPVINPTSAVAEAAEAPVTSEPTARVTKTANVRKYPSTQAGQILNQVKAGESVMLLSKTPDNGWYQVTSASGIQGYVERRTLIHMIDVHAQVESGDLGCDSGQQAPVAPRPRLLEPKAIAQPGPHGFDHLPCSIEHLFETPWLRVTITISTISPDFR